MFELVRTSREKKNQDKDLDLFFKTLTVWLYVVILVTTPPDVWLQYRPGRRSLTAGHSVCSE